MVSKTFMIPAKPSSERLMSALCRKQTFALYHRKC